MNINNAPNLQKKIIYDLTKFTTIDYKDHLSCIVWFVSCNMRCPYCYNPDMVQAKEGNYTVDDLYQFLHKRVGLLDSVVLSGGEATNHALFDICTYIKSLGFKIKLDTNGSNPNLIKNLLKNKLLDYIALDFKAPKAKFRRVTGGDLYTRFIETLQYLIAIECNFEVRTTLHADLLNEEDINSMIEILNKYGYTKSFYIQNFLAVTNLGELDAPTQYFDREKLSRTLDIVWRN